MPRNSDHTRESRVKPRILASREQLRIEHNPVIAEVLRLLIKLDESGKVHDFTWKKFAEEMGLNKAQISYLLNHENIPTGKQASKIKLPFLRELIKNGFLASSDLTYIITGSERNDEEVRLQKRIHELEKEIARLKELKKFENDISKATKPLQERIEELEAAIRTINTVKN